MTVLVSFLIVVLGLALMTFGGNILVDGAVSIAKRLKISEAIIGLTIVAVGTSVPELIVSIIAAIQWSTDIAIGNVLGSNIANLYLVLGVTATITTVTLSRVTRFFDLPVIMLTTLLLLLTVSDSFIDGLPWNVLTRSEWIIFLLFAFLYILYSIKHQNFVPDESDEVDIIQSPVKSVAWVIGGTAVLFFGWKILVDGAVDIARTLMVSESIIGLTIVAIGTSAPEMVTSVIAARRGNPEIAIGNVVGSSIMNIFVILGFLAIITPVHFGPSSYMDLFIALLAPMTVLIFALLGTKNKYKLTRIDGIFLIIIYLSYIAYLMIQEIL